MLGYGKFFFFQLNIRVRNLILKHIRLRSADAEWSVVLFILYATPQVNFLKRNARLGVIPSKGDVDVEKAFNWFVWNTFSLPKYVVDVVTDKQWWKDISNWGRLHSDKFRLCRSLCPEPKFVAYREHLLKFPRLIS